MGCRESSGGILRDSIGSNRDESGDGGADGKDASLRGVYDSSEVVDAKHAHVRDGKSTTLVVFALQLAVTRFLDESFGLS